jgi:hypothetical protein
MGLVFLLFFVIVVSTKTEDSYVRITDYSNQNIGLFWNIINTHRYFAKNPFDFEVLFYHTSWPKEYLDVFATLKPKQNDVIITWERDISLLHAMMIDLRGTPNVDICHVKIKRE